MSNTKFIKVDVSKRLPKIEKWYHVIGEDGNVDLCPFRFNEFFATDTIGQREVKFWLDEVADRESELIDMLEHILAGRIRPREYASEWDKVNELIQSVKQPK